MDAYDIGNSVVDMATRSFSTKLRPLLAELPSEANKAVQQTHDSEVTKKIMAQGPDHPLFRQPEPLPPRLSNRILCPPSSNQSPQSTLNYGVDDNDNKDGIDHDEDDEGYSIDHDSDESDNYAEEDSYDDDDNSNEDSE
ncbi:hypothetical protein MMC29_006193, partial [Sticta canariensis]|nr:hypothetical protein [Sticta canariensis]